MDSTWKRKILVPIQKEKFWYQSDLSIGGSVRHSKSINSSTFSLIAALWNTQPTLSTVRCTTKGAQCTVYYADHRWIDDVWRRKTNLIIFFAPAKAWLFIVVLLLPRNQSHFLPACACSHVDHIGIRRVHKWFRLPRDSNPGNVVGRPTRYPLRHQGTRERWDRDRGPPDATRGII